MCIADINESMVIFQGVNDPQTEADRRAQQCIVASLLKKFPGIHVEGEEVAIHTVSENSGPGIIRLVDIHVLKCGLSFMS